MVHPDQNLLPCGFILYYCTWGYRYISIMSTFLKTLYHPCLPFRAVKQNSIIMYCPPTEVRWFNFRKHLKYIGHIIELSNTVLQLKKKKKITPEKPYLCLKWPWKRSWWHAVIQKRRIVSFSLQMHLILWCELNYTCSLEDSWAHLQRLWMYLLVPSCLF